MIVLITGASGLIGGALSSKLARLGHKVVKLKRTVRDASPAPPFWNPDRGIVELGGLPGLDAVIHLAGESIAGLWTLSKKKRIRDSRINGTGLLADSLAALRQPPKTLLCASATGYYGDRGEACVDETSAPGTGFLPEVVVGWESAATKAASAGIRVVQLRLGIVLASAGGALGKMLPAFRCGLGGKLGTGRQFWSWVSMTDALGIFEHTLHTPGLHGPVNAVSPNPVTNREFTQALGRALRRPTVLGVPAFALRLLLGDMARETLLAGCKAVPRRLIESGFRFAHAEIHQAFSGEIS